MTDSGASIARWMEETSHVNWIRTGTGTRCVWPAFGVNLRVLQWIPERCHSARKTEETSIDDSPTLDTIDRTGTDLSDDRMAARLMVDPSEGVEAPRDLVGVDDDH
ncbi:MAG: phosphoenolpyruvate carboxykinase domain-containing protein [Acidobacteriota bacterium]